MEPQLSALSIYLEGLTAPHEEAWALPHARRVLRLARRIAEGVAADWDVLVCAAYLHDWGAFKAYRLPGVEHPLRSRQVVETQVLDRLAGVVDLSPAQTRCLLECIARHDYRDPRPAETPEALLLREADALDLLGAVGIAREYAWGPNDVEKVTVRIRERMHALRGWFVLPAAQAIAARRLAEMEAFLGALEEELRA